VVAAVALVGAGVGAATISFEELRRANIAVDAASADGIEVCRDWGGDSCASGSPTGLLRPGEDALTKYGWTDVDGFYAEPGQQVRVGWGVLQLRTTRAGWVKLPGTNAGTWTLWTDETGSQDAGTVG
jgi:hypothetical protein